MAVIKKTFIFIFLCVVLLTGEYLFYKKKTAVNVLNNPVLKMYSVIGKVETNGIIKADGNKEGFLAFGPYTTLDSDKYTVKYSIKLNNLNKEDDQKKSVGYCDVFIEGQSGPASIVGFASGDFKRQNPLDIAVTFNAPDGLSKIQFRIYQYGGSNISLVGLSFYKRGFRKFFIDRYGVLRVKTPYLLGIFFLVFVYLKLTIKNRFKKHFFYTAIVSIISGIIIGLIWKQKGFSVHTYSHYYDMWQVFYAPLWLPLLFVFFNFLYLINNHFDLKSETQKYVRYDRYSYLLIPVFILAEIFCRNFNTQFVLGNFYLGVLVLKSIIYFLFLWQNIKDKTDIDTNKNLKWSLFLSILTVYILITPWVNACFYTDGDETVYLLQTQSIIKEQDTDITDNISRDDCVLYHPGVKWTGWKGTYTSATILSFLMVPGYLIGGRLGASMTMNLFGGLLAINIFLIIYFLTKSLVSSFICMLVCAFSSPLGIYSLIFYPEIIAALIVAYTIRKIIVTEKFTIAETFFLIFMLFFLIFLKERYTFLSVVLALTLIFKMRKNYKLIILILVMSIIGSVIFLWYDKYIWYQGISYRMMYYVKQFSQHKPLIHALMGLLLDQESGLFIYAPLYIFGFMGLTSVISKNKKIIIFLFLLLIPYYILISTSTAWHTNGSPASRYIVVIIPILSIFYGVFLSFCKRLWLKIFNLVAVSWSFIFYYVLILVPHYRVHTPNDATGRNEILDRLYSAEFFPDLTSFFPSFLKPTDMTYFLTVIFILIFVILLVYYKKQQNSEDEKITGMKLIKYGMVITGIAVLLLAYSRYTYYNYQVFEAEDYYTGGAVKSDGTVSLIGDRFFSLVKVALRKKEKVNIKVIARGSYLNGWPVMSIETGSDLYHEKIIKIEINSKNWKEYEIAYTAIRGDLLPFWLVHNNFIPGRNLYIDRIIISSQPMPNPLLGFMNYHLSKLEEKLNMPDYARIRFEKAFWLGYVRESDKNHIDNNQ